MRFARGWWAVVLVLATVGCTRRIPGPTEAMDLAAAAASTAGATGRVLALAGWRAMLLEGDAEKARVLFDRSLGVDSGEPYALWGQAVLFTRSANQDRLLTAALDLCERAPLHALCALAARTVLDLSGTATSLDERIAQRVPRILSKPVQGDAAFLLRSALSTVLLSRQDPSNTQLLADLGVPTQVSLAGPFSPWHELGMEEPLTTERTGSFADLGAGPFGPLTLRTLSVADGRYSLSGEPVTGDVYLLGVDVEVKNEADYVLRVVTTMSVVATLDGTTVVNRHPWRAPESTLQARAMELTPGLHRLVLKVARESHSGNISFALSRLDGKPAELTLKPALGAAPKWAGVTLADDEVRLLSNGEAVRQALLDDAGDTLARFLAARDAQGRDHDGARRLLAGIGDAVASPLLSVTRANLELADRSIPSKVAHGRATRELEAALGKDKGFIQAALTQAMLALEDGRQLDALEQVKATRALTKPPPAHLLQVEARIELGLGLDAQAVNTVREASVALPGYCDAVLLEYDIARRRDAVKESDRLLEATKTCPGALPRSAEHFRARGQLDQAVAAWRALLATDESQVPPISSLATLLVAQKKFDDARVVLTRARALWPRNTQLAKQLADVLDHAGQAAEALALRDEALLLDGADLTLRRQVVRAKTGKELLSEYAITTDEALKSYDAAPGNEEANAAFLLDAAAIRAYSDGSQVDRIHIIQKALDQDGVQEVGEVNLPQGAQVLTLRTLKPDGTALEPESIEGKETVSMPGVQVGDLVEYEFLLAHAPRGPGQPGFTSSNFYFQVARQPNNWSTYVVAAPKGSGLKVDAHNMEASPVRTEGDVDVFRHEERRVTPTIPEPGGPPSANEWFPFVSVGAGATGNDGLVRAYADASLDKGLAGFEVERFAQQAAAGKSGVDAVRAVYVAVMEKLSGRDAGLGLSAGASVVQDRGSRTWLLAAALSSLGFDARLVAVRTFPADPSPYLFPAEHLLPYVCVRVKLPEREVWLDALVRYAPFGELPEFAMGEREAFVFPAPGKAGEKVKTPPQPSRANKEVHLDLSLTEDGVLKGTGDEMYVGFEAAQLAEALESLSPDQRDQALQQALSRYFGGADMADIKVDAKREVGGVVHVAYHFTAKRFARVEGNRMVLGSLTYPALLGRRFLALSQRRSPLFIEASESSHTTTKLTLPKGWVLNGPVPEVKLQAPGGKLLRHEQQVGDVVTVDELIQIQQTRVAPSQYQDFGQFAGEVDLVQQRDLLVEQH